jgi:hypothetical protein
MRDNKAAEPGTSWGRSLPGRTDGPWSSGPRLAGGPADMARWRGSPVTLRHRLGRFALSSETRVKCSGGPGSQRHAMQRAKVFCSKLTKYGRFSGGENECRTP